MASRLDSFFGIDFGTTSSATVGYLVLNDNADEIKYGDAEGRPIPSVVAIDKDKKLTDYVFTPLQVEEASK